MLVCACGCDGLTRMHVGTEALMRLGGTVLTENVAGFANGVFNSRRKYSIILLFCIFPVNLMPIISHCILQGLWISFFFFFLFSKNAIRGSVTLQEESCENTYQMHFCIS